MIYQFYTDALAKLSLCNQQTTDCDSCPYICKSPAGDYCSLNFHYDILHLLPDVPGIEARKLNYVIRKCEDCYRNDVCDPSCDFYNDFGLHHKHEFYKKVYDILKEAGAYEETC